LGAENRLDPSFFNCVTLSNRTRRSLPRAESDLLLPPSRAVIEPSSLMEMALSVVWNWIGPPRGPDGPHWYSSPVALICRALRV
jgi:hypothetical protein